MRVILTRVKSASVTLPAPVSAAAAAAASSATLTIPPISQINNGMLVLLGLHVKDTPKDVTYCIDKIVNSKLWSSAVEAGEGEGKPWRRSVKDIDGQVLVVSQFTLYATFPSKKKRNLPDFRLAMKSEAAREM
jgi:D-tyrosyl-tRNA(Tyr) deacylase